MIEIKGNYWDAAKNDNPYRYDAIVCTTNLTIKKDGSLVMGAGIARDFKERFKGINMNWGDRLMRGKHKEGFMVSTLKAYLGGERILSLVAFPTKDSWKDNSIPELIRNSALTLKQTADIMGWHYVLLPRPGCGMGGLEWENVKPLLNMLDERFKVIS